MDEKRSPVTRLKAKKGPFASFPSVASVLSASFTLLGAGRLARPQGCPTGGQRDPPPGGLTSFVSDWELAHEGSI